MSSDPSETKTRILSAALSLLEGGDVSIRMADVARAAGISRQALYLHYPNRADLLIATAKYIEDVEGMDARLAPSRAATSGLVRLDAYIEAWAGWLPVIHGTAAALLAMLPTDEAAAAAWSDRMRAHREGCEAAVKALAKDRILTPDYSVRQATDVLWTLLSMHNWETLTQKCGWSHKRYVTATKDMARILLTHGAPPSG